ncbi:hypothetical protein VP01_8786g1, partial [Puccinia sorghi]
KNLTFHFSKSIKDKTQESQMLKDFRIIIRISSPFEFSYSFLSFSSQFPSPFQDYVAAKRIKHKNLPEYCNNCHTIWTGITFVHKIQMYLFEKELVDPGDFHLQWHLKVWVGQSMPKI